MGDHRPEVRVSVRARPDRLGTSNIVSSRHFEPEASDVIKIRALGAVSGQDFERIPLRAWGGGAARRATSASTRGRTERTPRRTQTTRPVALDTALLGRSPRLGTGFCRGRSLGRGVMKQRACARMLATAGRSAPVCSRKPWSVAGQLWRAPLEGGKVERRHGGPKSPKSAADKSVAPGRPHRSRIWTRLGAAGASLYDRAAFCCPGPIRLPTFVQIQAV